ncbi:MAG: hypothetical protein M3R39_10245 [Actinomycetota bacterium]|nr:hypothetical protein [Actinomycetota bacterium]
MKWRQTTLDEIKGHLGRLGLSKCPVCDSGDLRIGKKPGLIVVGGWLRERTDPKWDPDANLLFVAVVICNLCGNTMFFDSDRFHTSDELTMFVGPEEPSEPSE